MQHTRGPTWPARPLTGHGKTSQGNADGDAHMQGKQKQLRKWGRRDVITGNAYTEHSNPEAPKTPDAEATPQALAVRKRGRKPSDYPPIKERGAPTTVPK